LFSFRRPARSVRFVLRYLSTSAGSHRDTRGTSACAFLTATAKANLALGTKPASFACQPPRLSITVAAGVVPRQRSRMRASASITGRPSAVTLPLVLATKASTSWCEDSGEKSHARRSKSVSEEGVGNKVGVKGLGKKTCTQKFPGLASSLMLAT